MRPPSRAVVAVVSALLTVLLAAGPVVAQTPPAAPLFIASTPYGASVILNGVVLPGTTPLLVNELDEGFHRLEFSRDGYQDRAIDVLADGSRLLDVDVILSPRLIAVVTPAGHSAVHPGIVGTTATPMLLPPGDYRMRQAEASLRIEPIYPRQSLIDGLQFAVPFFMLVAASLALSESLNPRDTRLPVSIETLTATSVAVGLLATDIALHADRRAFRRQTIGGQSPASSRVYLSATVESLFEFAVTAEADGDLALAAAVHRRMVREHPDSRRVPQSLYRAARIELTRGAYRQAESLFLELVTHYPTPDTYDLALRNLADLYEITGRYQEAIEQIDRMVFVDPAVPRELMIQRREVLATNLNGL
ncbi:MAG: PEGA domain-containing protein [Spirochaetaceae bacterium]|nr:MAG: PEGA domain-containing protein [Spirochaetaceae bacterium]